MKHDANRFLRPVLVLLSFAVLAAHSAPSAAQADKEKSGGNLEVDPLDWPHWRGPERNGISREKNPPAEWDPDGGEGSNLLWKSAELAGRSTPIVMHGRLYTMVRADPGTKTEGEKVVCVDAETGEKQWEYRFNVYLSDVPDTRVGWSCVVGDPTTGRVYAQGVSGYFVCLEAASGEKVWDHSMHEEYGVLSTYGGRTNMPYVFEDLVITSAVVIGWGDMRVPAHRFIAFDKATGEVVWFNGTRLNPYDTTYSSPTIAVIDGQRQMIFGSGDGAVWGFQPRTGRPIWKYQLSRRGLNVSPLVVGRMVYTGHSEENTTGNTMGSLVAIDASMAGVPTGDPADLTGKEVWRHYETMVGKSSPIAVDGKLITIDDRAKLDVWDLESGERIDRQALGTAQRSSPLYADGKIYTATNNGRWYTLELTEDGVDVLERMRLRRQSVDGSPIISHGRLYLPTSEYLYCIGKKDHEPVADPHPEQPEETPGSDEPAWVQVVPAEVLLRPGESVEFAVRLFNAKGQFLEKSTADFKVDGGGEIDGEGQYTAKEAKDHYAAIVTATVGDLAGTARIRVVPDLPWQFDFEDGFVPVTWVGMRNRHIVVNEDVVDTLFAENHDAERLYLFLTAQYTNAHYAGREGDTLVIKEGTPLDPWASLLEFMEQQTEIQDLAAAKKFFDPLLEMLEEQRVVASWEWSDTAPITLTVERGDRGLEGKAVMLKLEKIPVPRRITKLGTRSRGWCGPIDLHDYTVQCDAKAYTWNDKMPDMGLIAQGYALDLQGQSQLVEVRTWVTQRRMAQAADYAWKPGIWYTLKLHVATADGKAVVRGKAWPRESEEPAEWTVVATDESPNMNGAPGFYGNARDVEFLIDNVKVYPIAE